MRSDVMKLGPERAPHRGLMRASGLKDEEFKKPFIGICNFYTNIPPGHFSSETGWRDCCGCGA